MDQRFLSALGSLDRLVDHSKSFGHPPGSRGILKLREKVVVRQQESIDGAVNDDNLNLLISFKRCDDFVELRKSFPD